MAMKKLTVLLTLMPLLCAAQKGKVWKHIGNVICFTSAGFADQYNEISIYDFRRIAAVHKNINPQWANPRFSQYNKYKNGDPAQGAA